MKSSDKPVTVPGTLGPVVRPKTDPSKKAEELRKTARDGVLIDQNGRRRTDIPTPPRGTP